MVHKIIFCTIIWKLSGTYIMKMFGNRYVVPK